MRPFFGAATPLDQRIAATFGMIATACAAGCGEVAMRAAPDASASTEAGLGASDAAVGPSGEDAGSAGADVAPTGPSAVQVFDASCGPGDLGITCGPADRPCRLVLDELIDAGATENAMQLPTDPGAASLVVASDEVDILLGSPVGNVHANRGTSSAWSVEAAPGNGVGAIVRGPDGALRIVGNGPYPPNTSLPGGLAIWTQSNGGWPQTDLLTNDYEAAPFSAVVDGLGRIHAVVEDSQSSLALARARWQGAFTVQDIPAGNGYRPAIAVSAAGNPQVVFWGSLPPSYVTTALWAAPDSPAPEPLAPYGANVFLLHDGATFALAIGGGGPEQPHVLFVRRHAPGTHEQAFEVDYASRDPSAGWSIQPLATGDSTEFVTGAPNDGGRWTTFTTYRPVSVVIDAAGGVRLLYVEYSMIILPPRPTMDEPVDIDPQLPLQGTVNAAWLRVAWACGGTLAGDSVLPIALHPVLLDAFSTAVVGPDGRIHLAVVEQTAPSLVGRYLVLGP